jgi:AcrR family transcriptional regulator
VRPKPARQARSRRTLERLLDAAEGVLARDGLDGATVPAIAAHAGLSVGVVYRRFPDKDGLLRAVYERFLARALERNREALTPEPWEGMGLAAVVRVLVGAMVRGYRERRGLLRALTLYAQTHPDARFRKRAEQVNIETLRPLSALLLARRDEIDHPAPTTAIRFGLLVVAFALRELVLSPTVPTYPLALSDDQLGVELTRLLLGYLESRDG